MTGREPAIHLIRRWDLSRDDLNVVADALGVERVTDDEWAEVQAT